MKYDDLLQEWTLQSTDGQPVTLTFNSFDVGTLLPAPSTGTSYVWSPNYPNDYSSTQRPWERFWGPKNVAASCTHLGPAQVMEVIIIDSQFYLGSECINNQKTLFMEYPHSRLLFVWRTDAMLPTKHNVALHKCYVCTTDYCTDKTIYKIDST